MQLATWGTFKFKADAQKCADEIMEICEELESAQARFFVAAMYFIIGELQLRYLARILYFHMRQFCN